MHSDRPCSNLRLEGGFAPYAVADTLIVTLVNTRQTALAVNWARQLGAVGLRGLIGVSSRLDKWVEAAVRRARAALFCMTNDTMRLYAQAGRWVEMLPLIRSGFNVLLSDADVGWARNPLPYLDSVLRAHPHISLLISSNRAADRFSTTLLPGNGAVGGSGGGGGGSAEPGAWLELEGPAPYLADESSASLNIGIIFFHRRSRRRLEHLLAGWSSALSTRRRDGRVEMASYDQGLINRELHRRMRAHPTDPRLLALADGPTARNGGNGGRSSGGGSGGGGGGGDGRDGATPLGLGVMPALLFSTAHHHFAWRAVVAPDAPPPIAVHATCTLGRARARKVWVLREAGVWRGDEGSHAERFLRLEEDGAGVVAGVAERNAVGFSGRIAPQLRRLGVAMQLAHALNRSLVLPRLRCGPAARSRPCRAGVHAVDSRAGPPLALPAVCPLHYWLEPAFAEQSRVPLRPPSAAPDGWRRGSSPTAAAAAVVVDVAASEPTLPALLRALGGAEGARLLGLRNVPAGLARHSGAELWPVRLMAGRSPNEVSGDAWCRSCVGEGGGGRGAAASCVERVVSSSGGGG